MLPFIVSVACNNGEFDSYSACFAEAWLRATHNGEPTGAIGCFASSIGQSWAPPMAAQDEIVDLVIESYANNKKNTYGGLCFNGCMLMNDEYVYDGYEMTDTWHIFGDPSLQVRTNTPTSMVVNHESTIAVGATEFTIEVVGIEDALCAISRDYELLGSAYTDASGYATIEFDEPVTDGDDLDIVVTAYNMLPYFAPLAVGDSQIDADLSYVTLTGDRMFGMMTCPIGDGPSYQYVKVTVRDSGDEPIVGLPADRFVFDISLGPDTYIYGDLSCTFSPIDAATDANGEICFECTADTAITGDYTTNDPGILFIEAIVDGTPLTDIDEMECRSPDYIPDGDVDLSDLVFFAQDFFNNGQRSDFNWDGSCSLIDLVLFAQHYGHRSSAVRLL